MKNYKYLLIDLDDTLLDWQETERRALTETFRERFSRELTAEEVEVYNRINAECWKLLERKMITKDELKVKRFAEFMEALGILGSSTTADGTPMYRDLSADSAELALVQEINLDYMQRLSRTVVEFPDAAPVCRALAQKYRIFLITNGTDWVQRGRLAGVSFTDVFESIIISDEVGCNKPDPRFFRGVTELTGDEDPSHYLVIGDSLTSDIAFGKAIGADTVWVHTRDDGKEGTSEYTIGNLWELTELL